MSGQIQAEEFVENSEQRDDNLSKPHLSLATTQAHDFALDSGSDSQTVEFNLETQSAPKTQLGSTIQPELFLPTHNPEQPEPSPQLEFSAMPKPILAVSLDDGRKADFQHSASLLESLEAQDIEVHYQCREGYCGSCRTTLLEGEIHYTQEPMAWINDNEILPCCCIPKTNLKIKL